MADGRKLSAYTGSDRCRHATQVIHCKAQKTSAITKAPAGA